MEYAARQISDRAAPPFRSRLREIDRGRTEEPRGQSTRDSKSVLSELPFLLSSSGGLSHIGRNTRGYRAFNVMQKKMLMLS